MFSLKARNDSWQNLLSGLGTGRDKASYAHLSSDNQLPHEYLEQIYLNDDIAARICDLVPGEMLRQGFSIKVNDDGFEWKGLSEILRDTLVKARIFGAAFIYVGADDGQPQDVPLLFSRLKGVRFINVLSAKELKIKSFYNNPESAQYGHVELYNLNNSSIHESRLIPFFGILPLSHRQYPPSILQRVYPVLQQFHTAWQATSHLMNDAAQGVFKL